MIYNKIFTNKNKTIEDKYNEEMYNKLKDDEEWKLKFKIYSKLNRDNNKKEKTPIIENVLNIENEKLINDVLT